MESSVPKDSGNREGDNLGLPVQAETCTIHASIITDC